MKYIVGIDEAGRGPLAGPVTVCIIACRESFYKKLKRDRRLPKRGIDSKKLSPEARERFADILRSLESKIPLDRGFDYFEYAVSHVSNKVIDSKGISFAIRKAVKLAAEKLRLDPLKCQVLLDGGLKLSSEFKNQRTIIKGDEKEKIISWASILAKCERDKLMHKQARKFPRYRFEVHKGYGTASHIAFIRQYGLSSLHRASFCGRLTK